MAGFGRKLASYVGLVDDARYDDDLRDEELTLSLIHISEPTRHRP